MTSSPKRRASDALALGPGGQSQPLSRQEYVAERLRAAILGGAIPAGARLRQAEIAEQLEVSITPVREALRILTTEGLVETNTFNGWWVRVPTRIDLLDLYRVRIAICPVVVEASVAHITDAELDRAARILEEMERCADRAEWVRLNQRFHHTLETSVPGRLLKELQERLTSLSQMYVSLAVGPDRDGKRAAHADHQRLLDAYVRRDAEAATAVVRRHLQAAQQSALETLDESR